MSYGEFSTVEIQWHSLCSSDFASDRWIRVVWSGINITAFPEFDFRRHSNALFQSLAVFCQLSKKIIQRSVESIITSTLFRPQALSQVELQSKAEAWFSQYRLNMQNTLKSQLEIIQQITMTNRLLSGSETNAVLTFL